ncbi:MAG TPA: KpsF/GutQ family sugar-phosphate isomerase [Candidatus Krumholzibacteria bacterium]|nr:KpsF/GutQ family sugar-phosphate isomerase [Candidatus Krumholzibacteria bacterium]
MEKTTNHHRLTPARTDLHKAVQTPEGEVLAMGQAVFEEEAQALKEIGSRLGPSFVAAVRRILECQGRVLVTGLGKSGAVGRKLAATFTSTGTPALFVHPVEALHGDLGIATENDLVLAVSRSGHNAELLTLVHSLRALGLGSIAMTGVSDSPLAKAVEIVLDTAVEREVCPLNLTPTSSSTAAMVMGDALTVALLRLRAFKREDFAVFHPSGSLGRTLRLTVEELMHTGEELPVVKQDQPLRDAVLVIASKRLGCSCVVDETGKLSGFLTNGDLQRVLLNHTGPNDDPLGQPVASFMNTSPRTVEGACLARVALQKMEQNPTGPITQLVVVHMERPIGVLHLHDILQQGLSG